MAKEGNLEAPTRHPLDWLNPDFYTEELALKEMERVFDICHGCRRCVSAARISLYWQNISCRKARVISASNRNACRMRR